MKKQNVVSKMNTEGYKKFTVAGFSLMEAVVSLGLLGGIMMGFMRMQDVYNGMGKGQEARLMQSEKIGDIRVNAIDINSLLSSASISSSLGRTGAHVISEPDMLGKCLPGYDTLKGCKASGFDDPDKGFEFFLHPATSIGSEEYNNVMGGKSIYYKINGDICEEGETSSLTKCPLQVRTWFKPHCVNFSKECNKAISVTISYNVSTREGVPTDKIKPINNNGKITIPLQKGIQITKIVRESGESIDANGAGIFVVEQDREDSSKGLQFEISISNAVDLSRIELYQRSVTGTSASYYDEFTLPSGLGSENWTKVTAFDDLATFSSVLRNQKLMFDTKGAGKSVWPIFAQYNYDGTKVEAPAFVSGFYQFKAVAIDNDGIRQESNNIVSVRVLPKPQIVFFDKPSTLTRNCHPEAKFEDIRYKIFDDEGIKKAELLLSGGPSGEPTGYDQPTFVEGDKVIESSIKFDLSWMPSDLVNPPRPYTITMITQSIRSKGDIEFTQDVSLEDINPNWALNSNPDNIRKGKSNTFGASLSMSNCCTEIPSLNWSYNKYYGTQQIDGPATSGMSCVSDSSGTKNCNASVSIEGLVSTPKGISYENLRGTINLAGTDPSCIANAEYKQKVIHVLDAPGIGFHKHESLWIDFNTTPGSTLTPNKQIYLKIDYPPNEDVTVKVVRQSDGLDACTNSITFYKGSGDNPVYQKCQLVNNIKDQLLIVPVTPNVALPAESTIGKDAQIDSDTSTHNNCNISVNELMPSKLIVSGTHKLTNSPYGEDSTDNEPKWNNGDQKILTCYDRLSLYRSSEKDNSQDNFYYVDTKSWDYHRRFVDGFYEAVFGSFTFPTLSSGKPDFTSPNVPVVWVVGKQGSNNPSAHWKYSDSKGSSSSLSYTFQKKNFCSMDKVNVYSLPLMGVDTKSLTVRTVNKMRISRNFSKIDYMFICSYGKWKP